MTQSPFDRPEPTGYERPESAPYDQPGTGQPRHGGASAEPAGTDPAGADPAGAGFVVAPDEPPRYTGTTEYVEGQHVEGHVEGQYVEGDFEPTDRSGDPSSGGSETSDVAKQEAADLKDSAQQRGQQVADTAKDQAGEVKDTALEQGQQTADVAKQEAGRVVSEATTQVRDLVAQSRSELSSQAQTQQQRLASIVHGFADELGSMASASDQSGPLTDLAHTGARRGGEVAHWLENNEPSAALEQVRSFARRRPVAFLAGSLVAGVVVGRLTRGLVADAKDDDEPTRSGNRVRSDDRYSTGRSTMPETGTLSSDLGTGYAPGYNR